MTPEAWRRVKEVFQSALELPIDEREQFVVSQAGSDRAISDEVLRMLRHAAGSGLLDQPAWSVLPLDDVLEPGTRLGPYEILQQIGAGGMGRVYRARDSRLDRIVAIKILNQEFRHRLPLEARAISALNHSHVCALYDIGEQDGRSYLVMEYVEGQSLADLLSAGALPLEAVLRYGSQIASALAAAHVRGIVHRDLKPANIMITAAGVKVLDFGVARSADEETAEGSVIGTAAYMSPSQWNGSPADARTDIYALGLVLFEMAAGTRYTGSSDASRVRIPGRLWRVIEPCLRQDAAGRPQRMEILEAALERLRADPGWRKPYRAAVLAAAILAAVVTWNLSMRPERRTPAPPAAAPSGESTQAAPPQPAPLLPLPAAAVPVRHLPLPPPPPSLATLVSYPGMERDPSLSPDGRTVAFSWNRVTRDGFGIFIRSVDGRGAPVELTAGAEDWGPAWSPDSRRIAFRRTAGEAAIYWVSADGGPANPIAPIARQHQETLPQMSWSRDGKWIAAPDRDDSRGTQLYLFGVHTGERRQLTTNSTGADHAPAFSPGGKSLAYASCRKGTSNCDVFVIDLDREMRPVQQRAITSEDVYIRGLAWLPDGKSIVYSAGRNQSVDTFLWRVSVVAPGLPERIDIAGPRARHPTISAAGGLLAFTTLSNWSLMMVRNFR